MTEIMYFQCLIKLFALAVWDHNGRQYLPMFGYDGQIEAYAPAKEAITVFNEVAETVDDEERYRDHLQPGEVFPNGR